MNGWTFYGSAGMVSIRLCDQVSRHDDFISSDF
jgi:hypothetical protein